MKCTSCKVDFSSADLVDGVCDKCADPTEGNWRFGMLAVSVGCAGGAVYTLMNRSEKDSYVGIVLLGLVSLFTFLRARRWASTS